MCRASALFFFDPTATSEIYTLSLHDALPISKRSRTASWSTNRHPPSRRSSATRSPGPSGRGSRSEEHTSELQSLRHLVCRLLLEKKKKQRSRRQGCGPPTTRQRGVRSRAAAP